MAATNYTPIQLYFSTTASAVPLAANLAQGELAINITDGKLYYEDNAGVVQVIATKGAGTIGGSTTQIQYNNAGALAGNAAMTFNSGTNTTTLTTLNLTNALGATYGGTAQSAYAQGDFLYASATNTLSKLSIGTVNYILTSTGSVPQWSAPSSIIVQTATNLAGGAGGSVPYQSAVDTTTFLAIGAANRVMTSSGTAPQWVTALSGLTGVSSSSITNTSLTSGRVVVSTTGGAQADDADLTFDGTTLSAGGYSTAGLTTLVKTVKIGDSNFSGVAVFAAATPAKLYIGTGTVTDTTSAIGATNAVGAISSLAITPIAATNTSVTYTNASTLYIAGAPSAGTNVTLTNPYSLYIAAGNAYFGGAVVHGGNLDVTGNLTVNGNTTLGDATTDTVTVNGYMGVGGAPSASTALTVASTALTSTQQFGVSGQITGSSAATSLVAGVDAYPQTANASFTTTNVAGFYARAGLKGASNTASNWHGLYIADQTQGTNNYGITSLVSSGTNKFNIYASGTAQNYFAGNVGFGNQAPTNPITVAGTGNAAYTSAKGIVVDYVGSTTGVVIPIGFSWASSISTQNPYWGMGLIPTSYAGGTAELGFYVGAVERGRFTASGLAVTGTGSYSGSLTVGTTTALYTSRLTVAYNPTSTNGPIIVDNRSFGVNRGGAQWFGGQYNTAGDYRPWSGIVGAKENATDGNSAGFLAFYVNKNAADAVEAGRFTSTGNLVLGYTASYGGMLTVSPITGNPTTASSTLNQIQIGEASNNSSYRLNLGYTFVSGGYRGNIQSIVGGAGGILAINADGGNVGIGTNSPGYVLDVQTGSVNTVARFYNSLAAGNTDIYVNNIGTGGDLLLTRRANGDFWVYQSGAFPISLYTLSTKRFSVDASGRAGFGTGGPTADRYIDAACGGITLDAGSNQFGLVLNPTYANNVTATIFNIYAGPNLTAGTTLNNVYNLYLEAINSAGSTVNVGKWGVYQAGSADNNYFAGKVLVGTTSTIGGYPLKAKGGGVDGSSTVTVPSGVTTTIYTIPNNSTAAFCVVFGDNGSSGFCDTLIFLASTAPKVLSSTTMYGTPPARTYSNASSTLLQLNVAMDSSVRTAVLGTCG